MKSGPRSAEDRLARLLVMLPWLMEQPGEVPLANVAARYALTEAQVQKDLELVAMCGLPPFVDEMIDVFVDDGMVFVGVPRLFTRPLRLTAPEGFSLLAAARTAMELPGADADGPLGRGLAKLTSVLVDAGLPAAAASDDTAGVAIDLSRPPFTDELAEAAAAQAEVSITYYSPARDDTSERAIVPRHVFTDVGNWYVIADDGRSGERRTFRVDRIESLTKGGRTVPTDDPVDGPSGFFSAPDISRAVLHVAPEAQWVLEQYPVDNIEPLKKPAGWVAATMPISSDRWLARLVIRLGPNVRVVEPSNGAAVAADLARSILDRY